MPNLLPADARGISRRALPALQVRRDGEEEAEGGCDSAVRVESPAVHVGQHTSAYVSIRQHTSVRVESPAVQVGRRLLDEEVGARVAGRVWQHCGASTVEEVGRRQLEEEVAGRVAGRVWQHCRQPLLLSQISFRDVVPVGETGKVDRWRMLTYADVC